MRKAILIALLVCVGFAVQAAAQKPQVSKQERERRLSKAVERFKREPSVQDVMREAVNYYQVQPAKLRALRRAAKLKALLPSVTGRYGYGTDSRTLTIKDPVVPLDSTEFFETGAQGVSVTASWDLPTLVFNSAELQTYALTGIRIGVLKEVSRMFFIRRQVLLQILVNPPTDPLARVGLEQRVLEFTALIDAFTGGYFSRELEKRGLNRF